MIGSPLAEDPLVLALRQIAEEVRQAGFERKGTSLVEEVRAMRKEIERLREVNSHLKGLKE